VEALQPRALHLPQSNSITHSSNTFTTVTFRFESSDINERPPVLSKIASVLRAHTSLPDPYFGTPPGWKDPARDNLLASFHTRSFPLSSHSLVNVGWACHEADATTSCAATTRPSAQISRVYWTTSIVMPISLPESHRFGPTFFSCMITQTYILELAISYQTNNATAKTPIVLKLPLQLMTTKPEVDLESGTRDESEIVQVLDCGAGVDDLALPPYS